MNRLTRRQFIGKSTAGIGAAVLAAQSSLNLKAHTLAGTVRMPVGFQVWTIKDLLVKDFAGTLKMMAGLGYQTVEMCSPPGYEASGFGPLKKMLAKEMRQIIQDAGLTLESTHYGWDELRNNLDERTQFAAESGQKQMILSSFWIPEKAGMDDWLRAADELNKIGEKTKKSGIQMGYHNHHKEFEKIEGALIYDALMKEFDPAYVKMQFQVAVINIGYKASTYFKEYPGRFVSAHLADWSAEKNTEMPLGQGIVDWKEFFASLETGGVKNIFVEMGMETFRDSVEYIRSL